MAVRGRGGDGFGRLHVLTDPDGPRPVLEVVDAALAAGVPVIQVRRKSGTDRERLALVEAVLARCRDAGATCVVNDRVDLALAAGADGVHLGGDDLPVATARRLTNPNLLIGATVRNVDDAREAERDGADYLGVGPTFATATKDVDHPSLGVDGVARVAAGVDVPTVAIAGITADTAADLVSQGVAGVAVLGAVNTADDPGEACRALLDAIEAAR